MENSSNGETKYIFKNSDIKFPTFFDEKIDVSFRNENMTKEILIQDLTESITKFEQLSSGLTDIIRKNTNNFNKLCLSYEINSYDYVIIIKLIKELSLVILNKIEQKTDSLKLSSFSDYFENNQEDNDILTNQHKKYDIDFSEIKSIILPIFEHIKYIFESNNECGINFMCYMVKFILSVLNKTDVYLNKYKNIENFEHNDKNIHKNNMLIFFDLALSLKKLHNLETILYQGYNLDKNDIFNFPENSEIWQNLSNKKILTSVIVNNPDKIHENLKKANDSLEQLIFIMDKAFNKNSYMVTNLMRSAGMMFKFKFTNDEISNEYEIKENKLKSKTNIFAQITNIMDFGKNDLTKKVRISSYPTIAFRQKIYMKREFPEINLEYIKSILIKLYGQDIIEKNFGNSKQPEREKLTELEKMPIWGKKIKKEDKKYYTSTTLLNNFELNLNEPPYKEETKKGFFPTFNLFKKNSISNNKNIPNTLIIHIHGGGFLKSPTIFYENYLREIPNNLNIPLIGIDYHGAPNHPYPEGLNDCYQSYMWILNHCEKELGIKPEKIIFSGDSAGGNYILALTFLIIAINEFENKNIKLPDLLITEYPCCNLTKINISLSTLLGYEDFLLNFDSVKYIIESYRGYYSNDLDPFLSPICANETLLKKMPAIRFLTASHCPLRDDGIRLLYKMSQIPGIDVKGYDLKNYDHGFMESDDKEVNYAPRNVIYKEIREFLEKNK